MLRAGGTRLAPTESGDETPLAEIPAFFRRRKCTGFRGVYIHTHCLLSFWVPEMDVVKSRGFSQYREKLQKKNRSKTTEYAPCFFVAVLVDFFLMSPDVFFEKTGCQIIVKPASEKSKKKMELGNPILRLSTVRQCVCSHHPHRRRQRE